jgi:hypothetical protein
VKREWKPGKPIPERYSGMPVTFAWNDVALTRLLGALEEHYLPGYISMCDHIRGAMSTFTPPKPVEPTGMSARVIDANGVEWAKSGRGCWFAANGQADCLAWDSLCERGPLEVQP